MRLLALCTAAALATTVSFDVNAADLSYPPPMPSQPLYGVAPRPVGPPPQVIIVPGPTAAPRYNYGYGASGAPPLVGLPPNDIPPPVAVAPPAPCPPAWRCGYSGCGWQSTCVRHPERYSDAYGSPGPWVYRGPNGPAPAPYSGPYRPQVDPGPTAPYMDERVYRP